MSKNLKVGVFGVGRGMDLAKNFKLNNCEIVAICDFHKERLEKAIAKCDSSVAVYENFDEFKQKNKGIYYYFTRYGRKPHTSFDFSNKENQELYFIFGKESTGIPKSILKDDLEHCMRIPMTDKVRALNVSNSVAIAIYEALRQQDYNDLLREEPHKGADWLEK